MGEFLASVTSEELTDWLAFSRLEPWGDERADYHAAMICMICYQMWRGKNSPRMKLEDFIIKFLSEGRDAEPKTSEQLNTMLQGYTAAAGGKIKRGGEPSRPPSENLPSC